MGRRLVVLVGVNKSMQSTFRTVVARDSSEIWNKKVLRRLLDHVPVDTRLDVIAERRHQLSSIPPRALHESYEKETTKDNRNEVTPHVISLPPRYGRLLYLLCRHSKAKLILEAGSGFGISTMYLALAAKENGGIVHSYEVASYSEIAAASVSLVSDSAHVHKGDFDRFEMDLDATSLVDFCFIDARHESDSIIRSFKNLRGWMSPKSVIVVDDIGYSMDSKNGWRHIVRSGREFGFVATINDRFGILGK